MKHGFTTILVLALFALGPFAPFCADARAASPPAFKSVDEELKLRFLASVARAREPLKSFSEWQRLLALQSIEKETGLNLGVARMTADAVKKDRELKSAFRLASPGGIGKLNPKANALTFASAGKQFKSELKFNSKAVSGMSQPPTPELEMAGYFIMASTYIDQCRADEPKINRDFLKQMVGQPWAKLNGEYVLAVLSLRLFKHGCISKPEFAEVMKPLLPAIRQKLTAKGVTPGITAGVLFLLVEAGQFSSFSDEQLMNFVRAQSEDGAWFDESTKSDASMSAAFGASVISQMLKNRGVKVSNEEISTAFAKPPVLPSSKFGIPRP